VLSPASCCGSCSGFSSLLLLPFPCIFQMYNLLAPLHTDHDAV
jgi:hypothetical protein